jgi:protease I
MSEQRKVAALLADAFQEEEFFFPKVALNKAGYAIEVVSIGKAPIEIYSYFRRTGLLDVDRAIGEADPTQYAGILIAGGAKSPALLAEDERIRSFVRNLDRRGRMVARHLSRLAADCEVRDRAGQTHHGVQRCCGLPRFDC